MATMSRDNTELRRTPTRGGLRCRWCCAWYLAHFPPSSASWCFRWSFPRRSSSSIPSASRYHFTVVILSRGALHHPPLFTLHDGMAACADRLVGVAIGEKGREKGERECADARFVAERNRKRRSFFRCRWHTLSRVDANEFAALHGRIRGRIRLFGQQTRLESLNFTTTRMSHAINLLRLSATRFKGAAAPRRVTLAVSDQRQISHSAFAFLAAGVGGRTRYDVQFRPPLRLTKL